jgi:indole-3-glycerol phosphate synthase
MCHSWGRFKEFAMATILDRIRDYKLREIADAKSARPLTQVEQAAREASAPRPFAAALVDAAGSGYGLIAEIKKASPSKGLIRADFDPAALARAYAEGGATCLSVLTDGPSFQGAGEHLIQARAAVDLPVLRKDFLFDPYQVAESRAMGADCILIIMAAVSDAQAAELEAAAREWRMDVLVEVHDEDELNRAGRLSSTLLGINNRDLNSFEVSLQTTRRLARIVPPDRMIIAESGLNTPEDLADLARFGARCFLVGESLMRAEDVAAATRALLADPLVAQGGM